MDETTQREAVKTAIANWMDAYRSGSKTDEFCQLTWLETNNFSKHFISAENIRFPAGKPIFTKTKKLGTCHFSVYFTIARKKYAAIVMCESEPYKIDPTGKGRWGVNPISLINKKLLKK